MPNLNKKEYLVKVEGFVSYLKDLIDGEEGSFIHHYTIRDGRNANTEWIEYNNSTTWRCNSIKGAFNQYYWKGKNYCNNETILNKYKETLKNIFHSKKSNISDTEEKLLQLELLECCRDILKWGGVLSHNTEWMVNKLCDSNLVKSFRDAKKILISESPSITYDNWKRNVDLYRMNAGYTKIFSLLCDDFIIYDSRVAAGLGLLIRNFYDDTNRSNYKQPSNSNLLKIRYMDARGDQNRNPSNTKIKFKKMEHNGKHVEWNIYINWILSAAIKSSNFNWEDKKSNQSKECTHTHNKMRALESALFMIGYDIPN